MKAKNVKKIYPIKPRDPRKHHSKIEKSYFEPFFGKGDGKLGELKETEEEKTAQK